MHLPLTTERVAACYEMLRLLDPFCRWKVPPTSDMTFRVYAGNQRDGEYWRTARTDEHTIAIWTRRHSHLNSALATIAHEMIHVHQARAGLETKAEHNADFKRRARRVCQQLGFDFGQFC